MGLIVPYWSIYMHLQPAWKGGMHALGFTKCEPECQIQQFWLTQKEILSYLQQGLTGLHWDNTTFVSV